MSFNTSPLPCFCCHVNMSIHGLEVIQPNIRSKFSRRVKINLFGISCPHDPQIIECWDGMIHILSIKTFGKMETCGFIIHMQHITLELPSSGPKEAIKPIRSLNSIGFWSLAGRWWKGLRVSTHVSQTKSWAPLITCSGAPWFWRCLGNTLASGCPKFLCNKTNWDFSDASRLRKFGPCNGVGGGAHPSHTSGSVTDDREIPSARTLSAAVDGSMLGWTGTRASLASLLLGSMDLFPKMVKVSLLGLLFAIRWALVIRCHSQQPKSCSLPETRWMDNVCRQGTCCEMGALIGTCNRSVPLHVKTHTTCKSSFKSCWMASPISDPTSNLVFPTLAADLWARRKISCHAESWGEIRELASLGSVLNMSSTCSSDRLTLLKAPGFKLHVYWEAHHRQQMQVGYMEFHGAHEPQLLQIHGCTLHKSERGGCSRQLVGYFLQLPGGRDPVGNFSDPRICASSVNLSRSGYASW